MLLNILSPCCKTFLSLRDLEFIVCLFGYKPDLLELTKITKMHFEIRVLFSFLPKLSCLWLNVPQREDENTIGRLILQYMEFSQGSSEGIKWKMQFPKGCHCPPRQQCLLAFKSIKGECLRPVSAKPENLQPPAPCRETCVLARTLFKIIKAEKDT